MGPRQCAGENNVEWDQGTSKLDTLQWGPASVPGRTPSGIIWSNVDWSLQWGPGSVPGRTL